jgi:uncharacterized protein YggT (Ycf19 family)
LAIVDFILNLAALLLWLSWRSAHLDPLANSTPATLMGTLKKTEPARFKGSQFLAGLVLLLLLRAFVYWELGSPVDWTPKLNLGFIVLAFRSQAFTTVALYSLLSYLRFHVIFYFWLLLLTVANRSTAMPDPITKLVRLHLGRIARWPGVAQLLIPCLLAAGLWFAFHFLLVHSGVTARVNSPAHLAGQACLIATALWLSLKYLLPLLLMLHLINSYVFFGNNPFWDFVSSTSRALLLPLGRLPLRVGRLDLTPLVGALLVLLLLHWLPNFAAGQLARRNLTMWPQ